MNDSGFKFDPSGLLVGGALGSPNAAESRRTTRYVGWPVVRVLDLRSSRRGANRPVMTHFRTPLRVRPFVVGALLCISEKE